MKIFNLPIVLFFVILTLPVNAYCQYINFKDLSDLYTNHEFEKLESACAQVIKNNDKSSEHHLEALYFLSISNIFQGKINKARKYMFMFEESHEQVSHQAYKNDSEIYVPESSYIHIDARFLGFYYEIGKYYFIEKKDYKKAHTWLMRAKSSGSLFNDNMFNFFIGAASSRLGIYDEARKYYNRQLKNYPSEHSALYNIACTYALEQNSKKAILWLKKAIAVHEPYRQEARGDDDFTYINKTQEFNDLVMKK